MDTLRVRDLVESQQFTLEAKHRIISYITDFENGDREVAEWDSETSGTLPPERLLDHEITALRVADDGYLEIEFAGDEYMPGEMEV